ncbi:MAG: hypothetical protein ABIQ17_07835 [Candidatus Limnocylindrales bacterium]
MLNMSSDAPSVAPGGPIHRAGTSRIAILLATLAFLLGACEATPPATPAITAGTADQPRVVIIVAKDYSYIPPVVDLVPGEHVVLQIVNGGLIVHEVVIGGMDVQDAWEAAEAATIGAPPGPTPVVSVRPDVAGLRVVVQTGQRVDVSWTVPLSAATEAGGWFVGCHIPGHWEEGMVVPVRFVGRDGQPLPT